MGSNIPGVESIKVIVVRNMPVARRLPAAEVLGKKCREAIIKPIKISVAPRKAEKLLTLRN